VSEGAGLLLLVVGLGGLGATGALAACCLRLRSPIEYLLASYLLAWLWLVALTFALSPARWLTRGTLLAGIAVGLGIVLVAWIRLGRPRAPGLGPALVRCRDSLRAPAVAILVACLAVAAVYIVALAFFTPSNDQDALEYHLARAALWKQQHGLGHVDGADDARLNLFPPNAEIGQLATMLLAGRDRYATLPQLLAYVALVLSVAGLARRVSFGVKEAAFSAAAFATLPIVVVQAPSAMNDLVVGSFLTAAAYFGLATRRATTIALAVGVALAVGTKLTAFVALPTLALVFAMGHPRRRWPLLLVAIAAGCLVGSVWFAVNLVETGGLGTDVPNQPNQSADLEPSVLAVTSLRLALSVLDMSGAPGPYALVFIAAAIGLAIAGLVQLRRSRGGGALLLAAALTAAVVAIPVVWDVVVRVVFKLALFAGGHSLTDRFGWRLNTKAEPLVGGYGPLALVLLAAATIAVVTLWRRRRLPVLAVALAAAPLTVLVTLAAAVSWDPTRPRFLVFGVALSAATWGVALRARPLAYASGNRIGGAVPRARQLPRKAVRAVHGGLDLGDAEMGGADDAKRLRSRRAAVRRRERPRGCATLARDPRRRLDPSLLRSDAQPPCRARLAAARHPFARGAMARARAERGGRALRWLVAGGVRERGGLESRAPCRPGPLPVPLRLSPPHRDLRIRRVVLYGGRRRGRRRSRRRQRRLSSRAPAGGGAFFVVRRR